MPIDKTHASPDETNDERRGRGTSTPMRDRSATPGKIRGKGLTEGDETVADLPKNNLWLVMPA